MLKFITEEYLKNIYRKTPFSEYFLNKNEKLTPGGREFLSDKHIKLLLEGETSKKEIITQEKSKIKDIETKEINTLENSNEIKECKLNNKKIVIKTKMAMLLFYKFGNLYLKKDLEFSKKILTVGKLLENLKKYLEGRITNLEIDSKLKNIGSAKIDFEMDEIYIYQENNSKILELYYLSSVVEELNCLIEEDFKNEEKIKNYMNILLEMVYAIIKGTIKGENIGK